MAISRPLPARAAVSAPTPFSIAFVHFLANQDLAFAGVIGGADDAFFLHALHQRGGAIVADLQPALDIAGGRLAVAHDDLDGLLIEVVGLAAAHGGRVEQRAVLVLVAAGGDRFEI